jgi:hypothetical protein
MPKSVSESGKAKVFYLDRAREQRMGGARPSGVGDPPDARVLIELRNDRVSCRVESVTAGNALLFLKCLLLIALKVLALFTG